jgi:hypothetical protein
LNKQLRGLGLDDRQLERLWRGFSGWSPEFRSAADGVRSKDNEP